MWLQRRSRVVCLPCLGLVSRRPFYLSACLGGRGGFAGQALLDLRAEQVVRMRKLREISVLAELARKAGHCVPRGLNGGGWLHLAKLCGVQATTKGEARAGLRAALSNGQKAEQLTDERDPNRDGFLGSFEWRQLRMRAIKKYGPICMCCGASPATGAAINVDHIKPRKLFPQLALDINNLQILCHDCNHGKGNWDRTDWRPAGAKQPGETCDPTV